MVKVEITINETKNANNELVLSHAIQIVGEGETKTEIKMKNFIVNSIKAISKLAEDELRLSKIPWWKRWYS